MNSADSIINKLEQIIHQREQLEKNKQQYLQEALESLGLTSEPVSLAELHVLDRIGRDPLLNIIRISKQMGMTRGAISKICARLERKGLVIRVQLPANQKEVYFELTKDGKQLWELHDREHRNAVSQYHKLLEAYPVQEQRIIERFLDDLLHRL